MTGALERLPGGPTCSAGPRPDFPERTSLPVRTRPCRDGEAGALGHHHVEREGAVLPMAACGFIAVQAGDVFVLPTPGGGGYGVAVDAPRG